MKRFLIIGIWVAFLPVQHITAQASKSNAFDTLFSYLHQQHWFNGAIVAGEKGKIFYSKGFGYADFTDSLLYTPFTTSDGGSNAKTFTAAGILLLAQQGKLHLEDPVQKYLPAYPYANTTIFNLITHSTGGLPYYDFYFNNISDTAVLTTGDMINALNKYAPPLLYPPNTNFFYDSPGFDIAAAVIEVVTGYSYSQFLKMQLFNPANMQTAFVRPARINEWSGKRTKGYRYDNDTLKPHDIADREGFYGGSNIWLSATDLYHYGTSFYHKPFLGKKVIKKITAPVSLGGIPSAIRLGAWYSGKNNDAFYYWGDLAGFYTWVYWDKKQQFTIAFVTNTNTPQWVRPQLTAALANIMEGKPPREIKEPERDTVGKEMRTKITGNYRVPGYGNVSIFLKENNLLLRLPSGMIYQMYQVDTKTFYVPGLEPWLSFRKKEDNTFHELLWSATVASVVGTRLEDIK